MRLQPLPERLRNLLLTPRVALLLIVVNLAGTGFGFYYYADQFAVTSSLLWPFVPDSPLATLLMAASVFLYLRGYQKSVVDALAFIANFKYGLWTVFVLLFYFETFFSGQPVMYGFLLASHFLMSLQAFLVLEYSVLTRYTWLAVAWFAVNDGIDYVLDTHTWIYAAHGHPASPAMLAAVSLTAVSIMVYYMHSRKN